MPDTRDTRFASPVDAKPRTFDAKTRTVVAVVATATPVRRRFGREILRIADGAVDLRRAKSGRMALLAHHQEDRPIGRVLDAWVDQGELLAKIAFNDTAAGREYAAMAERGELASVSVGYAIGETKRIEDIKNEPAVEVTRWELLEVSAVSVPADPSAHFRAHTNTSKVTIMPATPAIDQNPESRDPAHVAREAERARVTALTDLARRAGTDTAMLDAAVRDGTDLETFRAAVLDAKIAADAAKPTISISRAGGQGGLEAAISEELMARMAGTAGPDARLRQQSLLQLGAQLLEARGERPDFNNRERLAGQIMHRDGTSDGSWFGSRASGMHTTSDFPSLLVATGERFLEKAFTAQRTPLVQLARKRSASDFRPLSRIQLGEAPRLERVDEHGEVTSGSVGTAKESFNIQTFARRFALTRQAITNDDLGAFSDAVRVWAGAAAAVEADLLAGILMNNPEADDGVPFFHATHNNLAASGGALSVETLGAARRAMREQTGIDGSTPAGIAPRHLVVGPSTETDAERLLATLTPNTVGEANPFAGRLELHVESRISDNRWFLFADPAVRHALETAYLDGREAPWIDAEAGWTTLGTEFRAVFDFGVGLADFRAAHMNGGE